MMTPKFSLQNVLDLRHEKVERLEVELGKALAACKATEELLFTLQQEHQHYLQALHTAQQGEINLLDLQLLRSTILMLDKQILATMHKLAKQRTEAEEKRIEVVKAKQDEETLEILKQKRHDAFLEEQALAEQRVQDDIYIARAFRNQQQGA
jgi:flagellar FliJ protein